MTRTVTQRISASFPELYRNFFPDFFEEQIPKEVLTTCHQCARIYRPGDPEIPGYWYYAPETKCCTYHPELPNYLVGGLLMGNNTRSGEGRKRILLKIRQRTGVTPRGISAPRKFAVLYKHLDSGSFGRAKSMLCPYYEKKDGTCTVWEFREATCATFFCKILAGQDGSDFWTHLRQYLNHVQESLVSYVLHRMGFDPSTSIENDQKTLLLTREDLDDLPPDEDSYGQVWKNWSGKEAEFFQRAYEIVAHLAPGEFEAITGIKQSILLQRLHALRQQMMKPAIPPVMKISPHVSASRLQNGQYIVTTEKGIYQIQAIIYDALKYFDGIRRNEEAVRVFEKNQNASIEQDLLVYLYQSRILVEA